MMAEAAENKTFGQKFLRSSRSRIWTSGFPNRPRTEHARDREEKEGSPKRPASKRLLSAILDKSTSNSSDIPYLSNGLEACCRHIKDQLHLLNTGNFEPFLSQCFAESEDSLGNAALAFIECMQEQLGTRTSMDQIINSLFARQNTGAEIRATVRPSALQFLFAVIGVCSMIYEPAQSQRTISSARSAFRITRVAPDIPKVIGIDIAMRPIPALLRELDIITRSAPANSNGVIESASSENATAVVSSNIAYSALNNSCRIEISWINYLDQHLVFDSHNKILYLFRYPAYCAAVYLNGDRSFLSRFLSSAGSQSTARAATLSRNHPDAQALVREVLLSYRILFSQDSKSRHLLAKLQSDVEGHGFSDPLLLDLCTENMSQMERKHSELSDGLSLPGSIFASTEFRYLGKRLLAIAEFSERHRPRKLRELYADRRDSEKRYTFWAVIWIGGISIILSALQLLFSIAQFTVGYKQLGQH